MSDKVIHREIEERRRFLLAAASASGLALGCAGTTSSSAGSGEMDSEEEAEVTPGEDLMQEHGVVERILLIYDESMRRLERNEPIDAAVVRGAAGIIRSFVEDYHEKVEEEFVFPRLETARREVELVGVLRRQHERGRELTREITRLSNGGDSAGLAHALRGFQRMYRPHAAREDTVLFPAFRSLVSRSEYLELGEQFEEREHELLGEHGFEGSVEEVARLESVLGIDDLSAFTG